jgi:hypothetical protein
MNVNIMLDGAKVQSAQVDRDPNICPICHYGISPINRGIGQFINRAGNREIERVFECPLGDCERVFIARYREDFVSPGFYRLYECVPYELKRVEFSESIKAVSEDFCKIYDQASKAERYGLRLVAGPGYRKALEFLIKDYLCRLHPGEKKEIEQMQLGKSISTYVKDTRIQATSSRAAWLGNDETHYIRKWEDKDLEDLKRLIALTTRWIEMEELTKAAVDEMPEGKK